MALEPRAFAHGDGLQGRAWCVASGCVCDYGVGVEPVESRTLLVLISPMVKTANGMPEELDPSSQYCQQRVWPSWMSHAEKEQAHAELFGANGRYGGPPYHPDNTPHGRNWSAS